jgi:RNA polymerase sigma-70 factor (ECF subfamily)
MISNGHPPAGFTAEQHADCARDNRCDRCFEKLMRQFQSPLLHFLSRRLMSQHDAEDVLQQTFFTAYRKLRRYKSGNRFSTWIFTIAHRSAASHRRKRWPVTGHDSAISSITIESDPGDSVQNKEMRAGLWQIVRNVLDDDSFSALWLHYAESMPGDQIGTVLGRSTNAVHILLHRARGRLEAQLSASDTEWRRYAK